MRILIFVVIIAHIFLLVKRFFEIIQNIQKMYEKRGKFCPPFHIQAVFYRIQLYSEYMQNLLALFLSHNRDCERRTYRHNN